MDKEVKALWKAYESQIAEALRAEVGPQGSVGFDERGGEKLPGRLSGAPRQIDIIVYRRQGADPIVVDCKCLGRRIHVRDVECFAGLLEDVGVRQGLLVTAKGYSKAARRRAASLPSCILKVREVDDWERLSRSTVGCMAHTQGTNTATIIYVEHGKRQIKTIHAGVGKRLMGRMDPAQAEAMFANLLPGATRLPPPPPLLDLFGDE